MSDKTVRTINVDGREFFYAVSAKQNKTEIRIYENKQIIARLHPSKLLGKELSITEQYSNDCTYHKYQIKPSDVINYIRENIL